MRVIVTGDWHLGSGGHLGAVDAEFENSRLRDAERILSAMLDEPHDALIFTGDLAHTAAPRPVVYRIVQRVLAKAQGPVFLLLGNHDWSGNREHIGLHVVAEGLRDAHVITRPQVLTIPPRAIEVNRGVPPLQVAFLPWTPPTRLFDAARHDPRRMNAAVAERLVGAVHALARRIDPARPSLLVGHWLIREGQTGTGVSVLELPEPVLSADDLETGPWDYVLFGHNHLRQRVGMRTWHIGAPMRTSWGEAEHEPGYAHVGIHADGTEDVTLAFIGTGDAKLVRLNLDGETFRATGSRWFGIEDWTAFADAIVRVRIACDEERAAALQANGLLGELREALLEAGARKVIGPQLDVARERRVRSDLHVESDPLAALESWLEVNEIETGLRPEIIKEAKAVMADE